jgi:hypothetical protein
VPRQPPPDLLDRPFGADAAALRAQVGTGWGDASRFAGRLKMQPSQLARYLSGYVQIPSEVRITAAMLARESPPEARKPYRWSPGMPDRLPRPGPAAEDELPPRERPHRWSPGLPDPPRSG